MEAGAASLPPGLDVLTADQERANLSRDEIFKLHPSMSMIAEVLTDFIVKETSLHTDQLKVTLYSQDSGCGLAFSAYTSIDGSIDNDVHDALHQAYEMFYQTTSRHMLEENDEITLYRENFFIGTGADKKGLVAFLYALAKDNDFLIGPDVEGERKSSIGAFTLADIIGAIHDEDVKREACLKAEFELAGKNSNLPAITSYETMLEKAKVISPLIDDALGGGVFKSAFYKAKHGYLMNFMPTNVEGAADKVDEFFAKMEQSGTADGIIFNRELSVVKLENEAAFDRLLGLTIIHYPAPSKPEAAAPDDDQDAPFANDKEVLLWDRAMPKTAMETIAECLHGLGRYHYDTGDEVHWRIDTDEGMWRLAAELPDGVEVLSANIQDMLIDLQNDGGEWEGLGILPNSYMIEFLNPATFVLMLEKYAKERGIYFGEDALKLCQSTNYDDDGVMVINEEGMAEPVSDDEMYDAQLILTQPDPKETSEDADEESTYDPSIINMLGERMYVDQKEFYRDIARLIRLVDSDIYGGPFGPNEIFNALKKQRAPAEEFTPAPQMQ